MNNFSCILHIRRKITRLPATTGMFFAFQLPVGNFFQMSDNFMFSTANCTPFPGFWIFQFFSQKHNFSILFEFYNKFPFRGNRISFQKIYFHSFARKGTISVAFYGKFATFGGRKFDDRKCTIIDFQVNVKECTRWVHDFSRILDCFHFLCPLVTIKDWGNPSETSKKVLFLFLMFVLTFFCGKEVLFVILIPL